MAAGRIFGYNKLSSLERKYSPLLSAPLTVIFVPVRFRTHLESETAVSDSETIVSDPETTVSDSETAISESETTVSDSRFRTLVPVKAALSSCASWTQTIQQISGV